MTSPTSQVFWPLNLPLCGCVEKIDGNDISVRDIVTSDGSALSVRQLDEFGEVINTEAVSSGEYIISGGQFKIIEY